jgi:mannose-1-phosphate guanylyltransferase
MAGGSGERFWPLSTKERPKQLLPLISSKTMIRETVDRLNNLVKPNDIYVATNSTQFSNIVKELPEIPKKNIIIEPIFRDTAAAILYGSAYISLRNTDPVITVLASDHLIEDIPIFFKSLSKANEVALNSKKIVTLGIKPSYPETGYGYIRVKKTAILSVNQNIKYIEKPNIQTAKKYLKFGNYFWNSGMFIFRYSTLIDEFKVHSPEHLNILLKLIPSLKVLNGINLSHKVLSDFSSFPKISIDFAIMEKSLNLVCIPVNFGWSDVGTFETLDKHLRKDMNSNHSNINQVTFLNSHNNLLLYNDSPDSIFFIDINDLIVVKKNDKLLILKKGSSSKIKDLLKKIS